MSKYLRLLATGLAGALILAGAIDSAFAEKRVALVIGESNYENVPQLPNPQRDATSMAELFKKAGFDTVIAANNVGNLDFKRELRKFEDAADGADIAVLYYAGHGIEVGGVNYVIPIDAKLKSDRDAEDEAVSLNRMVESLQGATKLRLVILDACRDNPFLVSMRRLRHVAMRGLRSGLGAVEPTGSNTLIAYAAKAGSTALDGTGAHSPFTTALLDNLTIPGLDVRLAFGRVRDEVLKITDNRQEPFVYGSLGGGNISLVPAPAKPKAPVISKVKGDYQLVQQIGTVKAWKVFIDTYKTGFYVDLAKAQVAKITKPERLAKLEMPPAPEPVRPSTDEMRAWDKIKDSTDKDALENFISRYPDSPLALNAQHRLDILERDARERAAKARAAREAARKKAEAEQRAKEAARLAAQQLAAQQKAEEERRKAEEEQRKENAQRKKEAARIAALKAENERRAKEAAKSAALRKQQAARIAALQAEIDRRAKKLADAQQQAKNLACRREQARLDDLNGAGVSASVRDDLKRLADDLTCERLRSQVVASLEKVTSALNKPPPPPKAMVPLPTVRPEIPAENTPAQVASAQKQLARLGCYQGDDNGKLDAATKIAIKKYRAKKGLSATDGDIAVTDDFIESLNKEKKRVCPVIVVKKPRPERKAEKPASKRRTEKRASRHRHERVVKPSRHRHERVVKQRRKPSRRQSARTHRVRPRASARASAGFRSAPTMIGVGF